MRVLGGRGGLRVRLDAVEAALLSSMFDDIADAVEADAFDADDPVRARLFPAGYRDDVEAAEDFRDLTESSLRVERAERARECAADIDGAGDVSLDADAAERWIRAVNDLRLALGTRLAISDDDAGHDVDANHPLAQEWAVYHWLTALQDGIVRKLPG